MDMEKEVLDWIDRYVTDQMNPEEIRHFELLLQNDDALRAKVSQHQSFLAMLFEFGERRKLRLQMDRFHRQLGVADLVEKYKPQHTPLYKMWKRYRVGVAIAASMGVLAVSLTLHYMSQEKLKGQSNQVTALRRKLEKILSTQPASVQNPAQLEGPPHGPRASDRSFRYGGTAFLVDGRGYLCTNFHVLDGADSVYVQNRKGSSYKVALVYSNKANDLAILQITDPAFSPAAHLPYMFNRIHPELGEQVFTLGYPRDEIVYNQGYLSASTGFDGDTLNYQVSMAVNPGNSGGPVLDSHGNILGILSGKQTAADGVAYAVRSSCLYERSGDAHQDSILQTLRLPTRSKKAGPLSTLSRREQIRQIQDYIYMVKAY